MIVIKIKNLIGALQWCLHLRVYSFKNPVSEGMKLANFVLCKLSNINIHCILYVDKIIEYFYGHDFGEGMKQPSDFLKSFGYFLGMSKLKFKPAYNPYTEPSMEIFR